jgi:hypothetical protein
LPTARGFPAGDGSSDKICIDRYGRAEARLDMRTHQLKPAKPGDGGPAGTTRPADVHRQWDKVDQDVAEAKARADADKMADASRRQCSADRRVLYDKCKALKDDAIAARAAGDSSKMEGYLKCMRDIPR